MHESVDESGERSAQFGILLAVSADYLLRNITPGNGHLLIKRVAGSGLQADI